MVAFFLLCVFMAATIAAAVYWLAKGLEDGFGINKAVERGVDEAWDDFKRIRLDAMINRIVKEEMCKRPDLMFVKQMQAELKRVSPGMSDRESMRTAAQAYRQFLTDEGVEFGDQRFAWDRPAAIELIHAYEIEYWDDAP